MRVIENKAETDDGILLVTPVWRDADRLREFGMELACVLKGCQHKVQWVIADDGSEHDERQKLMVLLSRLREVYSDISLHLADGHRGKGSVVREAWSLYPESGWVAFVDADGSLSPGELIRMMNHAMACGHTVLAIRKRTDTTSVDLSLPRVIAHKLFIVAVRLLVRLRCQDPQCGAKILRGSDFRSVSAVLREPGLAFDAELLTALAARGFAWDELPVTWVEKEGGKVRPARDAWGMLAALWRIRNRQRDGEFLNG